MSLIARVTCGTRAHPFLRSPPVPSLQQILEVGTIADVGAAQTVLSDCLAVLEAEVQCRQRAAAELREQVTKQVGADEARGAAARPDAWLRSPVGAVLEQSPHGAF